MYGRKRAYGTHAGPVIDFADVTTAAEALHVQRILHISSAQDDTLVQAAIDAAAVT